ELGVAQLALGDVQQHAVDPLRLALLVEHRTAAFPDPVLLALAVIETVFDGGVAPPGDPRLYHFGHALEVVGVIQLADRLAPGDEIVCRPARQLLHRIADEQHAPVPIQQAAKGHARDIADQRAVLLFTLAQNL